MAPARIDSHPALGASLVAFLGGAWLFLSPWVYGVYGNASAWNSWIVGIVICILAVRRRLHPDATGLSWTIAALGAWTFVSTWVYGYGEYRGVNSLFVGVIILCAGIYAANSEWTSHHTA